MSLFNELKRRNVFRVGLAYLVTAWVIAQVASLVLNSTKAPDWVMQVLLLVLGLGFIIALIISWAYELTPEGIKKEKDVVRDESITNITAKKLDYITLAAAFVVIGLFGYQQMNPPQAIAPVQTVENNVLSVKGTIDAASIAVLPFADLSPEGDQGYFSDGISEEILNVLAKIDGLRVASRTSAFAYKNSQQRIPEIASELKVRHILEGSVRRAGETIRVTAQLIDAKTDEHLLSETFDRELTAENVFAIQGDVAQLIATALSERMNIAGFDAPVEVAADTANLTTLDLYYEANALFLLRGRENLTRAIKLFEQITENEPDFARGWAGLSAVYVVGTSWGLAARDFDSLAQNAADRAIELNPNLSTPYAVLANKESGMINPDWSYVVDNFNQALKLNPDDANLYNWRALFWEAVGFTERALEDYETCLELDPSYLNCGYNHHNLLIATGREAEAAALHRSWMQKGTLLQLTNPTFVHLQARNRNYDDLLLALNLLKIESYPNQPWIVKELFEAFTNPEFDHPQRLKLFEERLANSINATGVDRSNSTDRNTIQIAFQNFDRAIDRPNGVTFSHWQFYEGITTEQKRHQIIESGLPAFWHEHGFPPQCRAVGQDDFECD